MTARLIAKGLVIATLIQAVDVLSQNVAHGEVNEIKNEILLQNTDTDQTSNTITLNNEQALATESAALAEQHTDSLGEADALEKLRVTLDTSAVGEIELQSDVKEETLAASVPDETAAASEGSSLGVLSADAVQNEPESSVDQTLSSADGASTADSTKLLGADDTAGAEVKEQSLASEEAAISSPISNDKPERENVQTLKASTDFVPESAVLEAQATESSPDTDEVQLSASAESTPLTDSEAPLQAPPTKSDKVAEEETKFEPPLAGQMAGPALISENASKLDKLVVDWIGKEDQSKTMVSAPAQVVPVAKAAEVKPIEEKVTPVTPTEPAKIMVERIVTDDDLATAAANVRKSWQILAPERIEAMLRETDADSNTAMQIAMLASVLAEIVGNLDFVKNATEPLVYIRGQSVGRGSKSTSTSTPRSGFGLLAGSALGLPLSLASRASQSFIGQAMGGSQPKNYPTVSTPAQPFSLPAPAIATPAPTLRSSPFSSLWPNGAIPKIQSDDYYLKGSSYAKSRPSSFTPSYSAPAQNAWNLYSSLIPRKLTEETPSLQHEHKERFGNFLHDELPRELKRKIWDEFVSDSRRAKSVEEQNALLRKLERGQDFARTRSPPRVLIEVGNRPLTMAEKVTHGANVLREVIKGPEFSVSLIEAARLFLATLEPESQSRLMKMLVENGEKHDGDFIEYKKTHEIDSELQIGLLLLNRLKNVLIKADL